MLRLLLSLVLLALLACQPAENDTSGSAHASSDTLRLCLDWSPNVLHAGLFYAMEQGWYRDSGLVIDYLTPEVDGYQKKPIWRLQAAEVDLAIGPSEHQLRYSALADTAPQVQAIATFLQQGSSCFVTKASSGLDRPAKLDGHTYLGYHTPLEREILAAMIRHDGGPGDFLMQTPPRLGVWEAFLADSGQSCWVFRHWEAVAADTLGEELHHFFPQDYGVPYGYSSLLYAPADPSEAQQDRYRRFLAVTERGYQAVAQDPAGAAQRLCRAIDHPNFSNQAFIAQALGQIVPAYLDEAERWGRMEPQRWGDWVAWLRDQGLLQDQQAEAKESKEVRVADLFDDRYLPGG